MLLFEKLPEEDIFCEDLYGNIVTCGRYLILIPLNAKHIWKYDLEIGVWKAVNLDDDADIKYKFFGAYVYGNKVIMLGHYYPGVLILNVDTNAISSIKEPFLKFMNGRDGLFNLNYVIKDDCLFSPVISTNIILKLNMESEEYDFIPVGDKHNEYSGIICDDTVCWLVPRRNGKYVVIDANKKLTEYALPDEFSEDKIYFAGGYAVDNGVVFVGVSGKTIRMSNGDGGIRLQMISQSCIGYKKISEEMTVVQQTDYQLHLEKMNGEIEKDAFCLNVGEIEKMIKGVDVTQLKPIYERKIFGLNEWIKKITDIA